MHIVVTVVDLIQVLTNFVAIWGMWSKCFYFWLEYSSSRHPDNRKKNTIVFGEGLADGLYDTTKTAKAKYSVNITTSRKKICMSLHNITADIFCVLMA